MQRVFNHTSVELNALHIGKRSRYLFDPINISNKDPIQKVCAMAPIKTPKLTKRSRPRYFVPIPGGIASDH